MNSTIYSADRATHIRIVALALIAAILVAGFAASVRLSSSSRLQAEMNTGRGDKAQTPSRQPTTASSETSVVRRI